LLGYVILISKYVNYLFNSSNLFGCVILVYKLGNCSFRSLKLFPDATMDRLAAQTMAMSVLATNHASQATPPPSRELMREEEIGEKELSTEREEGVKLFRLCHYSSGP
jgi:hypothetical protein